ncbi:MAG: hypothetical protein HBSAPP03_06980 [Phycisphaerae bacterium]|nr:MAG: hypothetical protein HBSAPP03_06980 [Phycisphaerae bacterium]
MSAPIADALVLVFPTGGSLRAWRERGVLTRESAMLRALTEHYPRVVLATHGGEGDAAVLDEVMPGLPTGRVVVVRGDSEESSAAGLTARVAGAVRGCGTVLVKTVQMHASTWAVGLAGALREAGHTVGFIARGGGLWTRFVAYEHGPQSPEALRAAAQERVLCQAADVVVGTTSEMVEDLAWRYGLDPSRCVVVPNYVMVDRPAAGVAEREPGLLVYAGQLSKRKRLDVLIRAVAALPADVRAGVRLEIHGTGPEQGALVAMAGKLSAPVVFAGRVEHGVLLERMRRCTIYVQASELEGHPKAVLEAMGMGAAVLVARSPGLGDVVTHGMNGLRVDADALSFATAIEELLRDGEWREVLGAAASRTIRQQYGLPSVLPLELEVHRRALAHGRQAGARRAVA